MKVYVTKYALTAGITVEEAEIVGDWADIYLRPSLKLGRDAFETWEEARVDAELRRQRRIASLKRQLKKLEEMRFEGVVE